MNSEFVYIEDNISILACRLTVAANGVALLFAYLAHFLIQGYVTYFYKQENQDIKKEVLRRLAQTSRVMFWFGIATMFSIYPPYYFGIHSAVLGWVALTLLVAMNVNCIIHKSIKERSLWSLLYYFYHLVVVIWILIALIMGYIWSNRGQMRK